MHENMIGGAVLTNWLAILGIVSLMYWAWRIIAAFQRRGSGGQKAAATSAATAPAAALVQPAQLVAPNQDIVVIAAAVYAMLGTQRIVHLESIPSGKAWEIEGRWAQQTSHTPR